MKQKSKKTRNVIRIAVVAVVGVVLGLCIYSWNASNVAGNKMPMPFGVGVSVVLSGSMEPELSVDDMIIVKATDEFFVGQVVVFQDGNSLVVHRIIKIDGDAVTTQGDANNSADKPISTKDIKGEVVLAIPYVGLVTQFLQSPVVMLLLVVLAVYLLEKSFRKEKDQNQDELEKIKEEIKELAEDLKQDKK